MVRVEHLERADAEQLAVAPEAEERHVVREQAVELERVHILGRAVLVREREVPFDERVHVAGARIVGCDRALDHRGNGTDRQALVMNPAAASSDVLAVWSAARSLSNMRGRVVLRAECEQRLVLTGERGLGGVERLFGRGEVGR